MALTLMMIALVLLTPSAIIVALLWSAKQGYEDEGGFHYGTPPPDKPLPEYDPAKPNRWLDPRILFSGVTAYVAIAVFAVWFLA